MSGTSAQEAALEGHEALQAKDLQQVAHLVPDQHFGDLPLTVAVRVCHPVDRPSSAGSQVKHRALGNMSCGRIGVERFTAVAYALLSAGSAAGSERSVALALTSTALAMAPAATIAAPTAKATV